MATSEYAAMISPNRLLNLALHIMAAAALGLGSAPASGDISLAQEPLYLGGSAAPLNMLVLGRDHRLYYEAYDDASDLDGDGVLNVGYTPGDVDYFGYFDSNKCYGYSAADGRFYPTGAASQKTCGGSAWSGDFLNYLTTSRMDALRKVLYGGRRIVDTDSVVVLERSYIPQDAHSWGKEYRGIAHDGYDIRDYAPLDLPFPGTRHLFANTTLDADGDNKAPRLRVLIHSDYRIWQWVAIERPVAGDKCEDGGSGPACARAASSSCSIMPDLSLTQRTYKVTTRNSSTGSTYPLTRAQFDALVSLNAKSANFCGQRSVTEVNGGGNPFSGVNGCQDNNYLTLFEGTFTVESAGTYTFAIDGDDAVDLAIDGNVIVGWYDGHARCGNDNCRCYDHDADIFLAAGQHTVRFRHEENSGDDYYYLRWRQTRPASTMTDYYVRVRVCNAAVGLEANCRVYPSGNYKPAGLLQRHGEDEQMLFGLISGTYTAGKNTKGGVLRKNMGSITDEINLTTGALSDTVGIIRTIDRMRIVDFQKGTSHTYSGGWEVLYPMTETTKQFPDWGNPIAEMMYEAVRYFAGKDEATADFRPNVVTGMEEVTLKDYAGTANKLRLPIPAWTDPFDEASPSTDWCSAGAMLVISDVYPSYDTDQVPGSAFASFSGDLDGLDVSAEADDIWVAEHGGGSRQHFIGQSGDDYDGAPSEKTVTGFSSIRGLAPAEPTKEGGWYSAAVSKYAFETDLRGDLQGSQNINTVVVALASPLPRIEIPVSGNLVTIVPFAKSVGGSVSSQTVDPDRGEFQPTNTIVDFFVDTFANTDPGGSDRNAAVNDGRPYVKFRINFEDVEQGADHDMDAIVIYEVRVNGDNTLTVNLTSEYAAGSIMHHLGYVISGTTADGMYLEVRDKDTSEGSDPDYFLDTPAGMLPGACEFLVPAACRNTIPLTASRTFTPHPTATGATLLESPLWYAAKYGTAGSEDLDEGETSSNYFLVTNASNLEKQLESAFYEVLGLISSASAAATNSTLLRDDTLVYQARFDPDDWSGEVRAMEVNFDGSLGGMRWSTNLAGKFPAHGARRIVTYTGEEGVEFTRDDWADFSLPQCAGLLATNVAALEALVGDCGGSDCTCGHVDAVMDTSAGKERLDWLRGVRTEEDPLGTLRRRNRLLGDIVNSNPFLVDIKDYNFQMLVGNGPETDYETFRNQLQTVNRRPVLYVGANDGMLHGFDGNTGAEVLAFVPLASYAHIASLADPQYKSADTDLHRFFVDGSPWALDAFIAKGTSAAAWRTVLVGAMGAGGRSVFALDVTDPDHFSGSDVLWEFTDAELGATIGRPTIARVRAGNKWVAIFGNGYNSDSGRAQLYIVDLATGDLLKRIDTGVGTAGVPNGLASPTPVDADYNRITDAVYAGDLYGNMWKFDLSGEGIDDWGVAFAGAPLFTATDPLLVRQPITSRPAVAQHPFGGLLVMFGTGRFFAVNDDVVEDDTQIQSFYGIRDNGVAVGTRQTALQQQTIMWQGPSGDEDIRDDVRVVSDHSIDWTRKSGWYIDLVYSGTAPEYAGTVRGERVIDHPVMRTDRVVFTTMTPNADDCSSGGSSWLMELDFLGGGRLPYSVFDLNDDDSFGIGDLVSVQVPGAGLADPESIKVASSGIFIPAIAKVPAFVSIGYKDVKYSSLSSGSLLDVDNRADAGSGRQSWRQLR